MSEINFEEDQQDLIEKTDIQTLASFCRDLQSYENEIAKLEELVKDKKQNVHNQMPIVYSSPAPLSFHPCIYQNKTSPQFEV